MRWGLGAIVLPAYFVLSLYAVNADQLGSSVLPAPLVVAVLSGLLVYAAARALLDRDYAAACWSVLFWVAFLSFGWLQGILEGVGISVSVAFPSLLFFWGIALWWSGCRLKKTRRDLGGVVHFLDVSLVVLLVMVVGGMFLGGQLDVANREKYDLPGADLDGLGRDEMIGDAPDIYYLVLDGYAREDVLRELFEYDDGPFLRELEAMGFYVAGEARSNYPLTSLSLSASLNYSYLEELPATLGRDSIQSEPAHVLIRENDLMRNLGASGYRIVHFNSGWWPTEQSPHADVYHEFCRLGDQFPSALLGSTPLRGLSEMAARARIIETFEELPVTVSGDDAPSFVFAHVILPHPPYLLGRHGRPLEGGGLHVPGEVGADAEKYLEAVRFASRSVLDVVEEIVARTEGPDPIIILTSDHGTSASAEDDETGWDDPSETLIWERTSILSAYRVPPDMEEKLYPEITPVNGVRLLLSEVLGADLPPLEDRVFFSSYNRPYDWTEVTDLGE
ncbi:MAG: hypothetical protein R6U92_08505 [Bacillota bacterium]